MQAKSRLRHILDSLFVLIFNEELYAVLLLECKPGPIIELALLAGRVLCVGLRCALCILVAPLQRALTVEYQ